MINRLLLFLTILTFSIALQSVCQSVDYLSKIDISNSKIVKTSVYQYQVELYNNQVNLKINQRGQLVLLGNFSTIRLANKGLKKQYIYQGRQLILLIPSTHLYSKNMTADAEIQIVYYLQGQHRQNNHKILRMSQLYLVTKFLSKIQISIYDQINQHLQNGSTLFTQKLLKIIDKTPILMYEGSKQVYPCNDNLLCMVRKEFALISQQDINNLKTKMNLIPIQNLQLSSKPFHQRQLLEVSQMERKINQQEL